MNPKITNEEIARLVSKHRQRNLEAKLAHSRALEFDLEKGFSGVTEILEQELKQEPFSERVPFPFQKKGAEFLASKFQALLADEMGLGKTIQAVLACDLINAKKIFVLCPSIARNVWLEEFKLSSPISRTFQIITSKKQIITGQENVICSYSLAPETMDELEQKYDVLILDEAHMLKSTRSFRAKYVLGKNGIVRQAKRVWAISGTPAPNHAGELWLLFYTFGITRLSFMDFQDRYCHVITPSSKYGRFSKLRHVTGTKTEMIPELREMLSKFTLRRTKEDVMDELKQFGRDLPPIIFDTVTIDPQPVDLEIAPSLFHYVFPEDRRDELFDDLIQAQSLLNGIVDRAGLGPIGTNILTEIGNSLATLRKYTGLQKAPGILDLVTQELESNAYEKIVIFAIHQDVIEYLRRGLQKFNPVTLYGKTPLGTRTKNIEKFQTHPKTRVFIGNIMACGTAITLTAAHHLLFAEQDWVPGNNAQAAMRVHRIGQTKPVFVRTAALPDSLDQKIQKRLLAKTQELVALFDDKKELHSKKLLDG